MTGPAANEPLPLVRDRSLRFLSQPVLMDHDGRQMRLYAYSYRHGDKTFSFNIWAWSMRDARRRLRAIKRTLRLDGVIVGTSERDT
ncbi:hypothetical protein [Neorhizobium petrolearium]|uniref:hypothetical protein n=1 Tax=Neorhizobium petrolearium TaxID=515361 RepID=UPI003F7DE8EE